MRKNVITFLNLFALTLSLKAQSQVEHWPEVKKLKSGNALSTFVYDYWDYSKKNGASALGQYLIPSDIKELLIEGPIVGDYHFNNVALYYNQKTKQPELAIADLDDSGTGSYFFDLIKFYTYLTDEKVVFSKKEFFTSYSNGLNQSMDELKSQQDAVIGEMFELDKTNFDKANEKYTTKKHENNKFAADLKLSPVTDKDSKKLIEIVIQEFAPKAKILDMGSRINVSGSSMGSIRYWILIQVDSDIRIIEFKELKSSSVIKYTAKQLDQEKRFSLLNEAFKSTEYWKNSKILTTKDKKSYLLRLKTKNQLEDIVLDLVKDNSKELVRLYAGYLGFIHSQKMTAAVRGEYIQVIDDNMKNLINFSAVYSESYIKSLEKRMKKNK